MRGRQRKPRLKMDLPIPPRALTERARRALSLAQNEAMEHGHDYLGTEHLLLGLIDEGEGVASAMLESLVGDVEKVREAIGTMVKRGDRSALGDVPLTPRASRSLVLAQDEAKRFGHHYIGTEHMVLGLLGEGGGIAAGVLGNLGVTLDGARNQMLQVLMDGGQQVAPRDEVITCRVNQADLEAIDALIEAGVRSSRSDAAAWLIHAGIDANRSLLDKVNGTVSEIRRLREVARSLALEVDSTSGEE